MPGRRVPEAVMAGPRGAETFPMPVGRPLVGEQPWTEAVADVVILSASGDDIAVAPSAVGPAAGPSVASQIAPDEECQGAKSARASAYERRGHGTIINPSSSVCKAAWQPHPGNRTLTGTSPSDRGGQARRRSQPPIMTPESRPGMTLSRPEDVRPMPGSRTFATARWLRWALDLIPPKGIMTMKPIPQEGNWWREE
jgi:hypothetical protein